MKKYILTYESIIILSTLTLTMKPIMNKHINKRTLWVYEPKHKRNIKRNILKEDEVIKLYEIIKIQTVTQQFKLTLKKLYTSMVYKNLNLNSIKYDHVSEKKALKISKNDLGQFALLHKFPKKVLYQKQHTTVIFNNNNKVNKIHDIISCINYKIKDIVDGHKIKDLFGQEQFLKFDNDWNCPWKPLVKDNINLFGVSQYGIILSMFGLSLKDCLITEGYKNGHADMRRVSLYLAGYYLHNSANSNVEFNFGDYYYKPVQKINLKPGEFQYAFENLPLPIYGHCHNNYFNNIVGDKDDINKVYLIWCDINNYDVASAMLRSAQLIKTQTGYLTMYNFGYSGDYKHFGHCTPFSFYTFDFSSLTTKNKN